MGRNTNSDVANPGLRPNAVLVELAGNLVFLEYVAKWTDDSEGSDPKFRETCHDGGKIDMADCFRAYCERDLSEVNSPDHVSARGGETHDPLGNAMLGRLTESGFSRALEQSTGGHPESDSAG